MIRTFSRALKPRRDRQRGIAVVEFGLMLPIFMVLFFGIIEFGMAMYKQQILAGAAREAARYGSLASDPRPSASEVQTRARNYVDSAGLNGPQLTVAVTGAGGDAGGQLSVDLGYPTEFGFLSKFLAEATSIPEFATLKSRVVLELQ